MTNKIDQSLGERRQLRVLDASLRAGVKRVRKRVLASKPKLAANVAWTLFAQKHDAYRDQLKRLRPVFAELIELALTAQACEDTLQPDWPRALALALDDMGFARKVEERINARVAALPEEYERLKNLGVQFDELDT